MSSAKDVMARRPQVTCPLIALREFQGSDLIALCVSPCVSAKNDLMPEFDGWKWAGVAGGTWRQVETARREKVEKITFITSSYFEELSLKTF